VTVPSQNGRIQSAGVRIHRSRRLPPDELTVRSGIPVTSVERTLLDLADVLDPQGLRRAVMEAEYRNLLDHTTLIAVVQNNQAGVSVASWPRASSYSPPRRSRISSASAM
jgi:hypothetical protein